MPMGKIYRYQSKGLNRKQFKQVSKIVNKGKRLKTEFADLSGDIDGTGIFQEITAIAEGDDFNQRDSDVVFLRQVKICMALVPPDTATKQSFRILVVRSKTGPLVVGDMLTSVSGEPDLDKYQVLYDERFGVPAHDIDPIKRNKNFKFYNRKIPHLRVIYDDDESDTAAQNHGVYIQLFGSEDTHPAFIRGWVKAMFYDSK